MLISTDYQTPSLVNLDSKEDQLEALQVVREGASLQYKNLMVEEERIDIKLKKMVRSSGHNTQSFFAGGDEPDTVSFKCINNRHIVRNNSRTEEHMDPPYGNINHYMHNDGGDGYQILHPPRIEHHNTLHSDRHPYDHGCIRQYRLEPSLAEGVMQAHKPMDGIQTKINTITGKEHPFD